MSKQTQIVLGTIVIFIIGWIVVSLSHPSKSTVVNTDAVKIEAVLSAPAPDTTFTTIDGKQVTVSSLRGKKVMLWLVATWCSSCAAGVSALTQNLEKINGLTVIVLKINGNAGYPGPSIKEFKQQYMPAGISAPSWLWGDASKKMTSIYNPRNYPDIYFLIDKKGVVKVVSDAPAATLGEIITFANK